MRPGFVRYLRHYLEVMNIDCRNIYKCSNFRFNIVERVHFDASFMFAKLCPFKHQQAEVNRGGIKRIDMTVKLKDLINSALACPIYHECSVFLKEAIGTPFSCFAKIAPCYRLPDPEMIEFSGVSHHRHDEILEALTVEKLAEHYCK